MTTSENAEALDGELRLIKVTNPATALGLAVSHLMVKPAFANLPFGDWSRILTGQINRGHCRFAVDSKNQVQGFFGWALTTKDKADAWVNGRRPLSYEDSRGGDCMVFNAWSANNGRVHRFMIAEARQFGAGCTAVYFKRHYADGRTKPVRIEVKNRNDAAS